MRLVALLLIGLLVLPVWALGDNSVSSDTPQTTEIPDIGNVASPTNVTPIPPTTALLPTSTAAPATAIFLPFTEAPALGTPTLTASPVSTQSGSPTEAVTTAPTSLITSTASIVAPSPEVSPAVQPTNTISPTDTAALPFPTVDLTTAFIPAPTTTPMRIPLTLPALATMDDGASDWYGTLNWSLQPHDDGLAWFISGTGSGILYWQTPISLLSATTSVTLSFQSRFAHDGLAAVQVSRDGLNWQPVSVVPASEIWGNVSVDLSGYIGSVIYIGFSWQGASAETQGQWAVDTISVVEAVPTLIPPAPTGLPTATALQPLPTLQPSGMPTDVTPIEESDPDGTLTSTAEPGDSPPIEQTEEVILVPEPTIISTEGIQATPTTVSPVPIVCELDIDTDGTVTEIDLAEIGRAMLNGEVKETLQTYDLNGNYQIDIGDLQMMAGYLYESCSVPQSMK